MARIRVQQYETSGEDFPRMCMLCGQPAERDVPQMFAWMPGWVHVFILAGLLPWLVVALVTRKTMRIVAPMCRKHAGHWRVRKLFVWLGLLFFVALFVGLVVIGNRLPEDVVVPIVGAALFGGLIWLITGLILMNGAIKAVDIGEDGMVLVKVHKKFARAWGVD